MGYRIVNAWGYRNSVFLPIDFRIKITDQQHEIYRECTKYTLLALWVISVGALIALGLKQATQIAFDAKTVQKQKLELNPKDTLFIKFAHNDYYAKDVNDNHPFLIAQDSAGNQVIYSNGFVSRGKD